MKAAMCGDKKKMGMTVSHEKEKIYIYPSLEKTLPGAPHFSRYFMLVLLQGKFSVMVTREGGRR